MRTTPLLGCLFALMGLWSADQGEDPRREWTLAPTWTPGQELVYRGTIKEHSKGQGVQFAKEFRLEVRALVLEVTAGWAELACCTKLQQLPQRQPQEASSLRLAMVTVDGLCRLRPGLEASLPPRVFDGPTVWESGFLLELPAATLQQQQSWTLTSAHQPPRQAVVQGPQTVGNVPCVLIQVRQQSDDWDRPRADRTAWRLEERCWLSLRHGLTQRVERVIERRAPAHRDVTHRITTEYELESQLRYDGLFLEDRRRDIQLTLQIDEQLRLLLRDPGRAGPAAFEAVVAKIDAATRQHPATPYREAVLRLRHQAVAGSQHRLTPPVAQEPSPARTHIEVGQAAPDFVTRELEGRQTFTLRGCRGKPVLLAFFHPASLSTPALLKFMQEQQEQRGDAAVLAALCLSDQTEPLPALRRQLRLTVPILAGRSLRWTYGVEATPHFVLVDAAGLVQAVHTGWGPETSQHLEKLLRPSAP
jgi:peroxiredoxin